MVELAVMAMSGNTLREGDDSLSDLWLEVFSEEDRPSEYDFRITLGGAPGLGITVDETAVRRLSAS